MTTSLLLPPEVEREKLIEEAMSHTLAVADEFNRELEKIDDRLKLIYVGERFPDVPGIVRNRWHIVRLARPGTREMPTFKPILAPDGGYRDPDSRIFDELRAQDMWRGDVMAKIKRQRLEDAAARQRRMDEMRAEAREEMALRWKAISNPSVWFGGKGWTARVERGVQDHGPRRRKQQEGGA